MKRPQPQSKVEAAKEVGVRGWKASRPDERGTEEPLEGALRGGTPSNWCFLKHAGLTVGEGDKLEGAHVKPRTPVKTSILHVHHHHSRNVCYLPALVLDNRYEQQPALALRMPTV